MAESRQGQERPAPDTLTPKGRATRTRLLQAGRAVLEERGYFEATVGDIAARSGVALGGFYHYFPNKDRLFLVLLEELVETLYASTTGAWRPEAHPRDNLRETTRRYLEAYFANRQLISSLLGMAGAVPECAHLWWNLRTRTYRRLEDYLRKTPGPAPARAGMEASALGGMVEFFAHHWYVEASLLGRELPSLDESTELLSDIWYRATYLDGD